MQFDGVDDGVNLGNLLATGLTQISAAAWINKTDAVDDGFVIAKASTASPSDPGYGWSLGVAGRTIQVSLQNGAALTTFDGPLVLTKRWYHVAFTYDGSTVRIYLNGRQRKAYDYSGGIPASDSPVVIGGGNAAGDAATFGGLIDEVRLYDTPLSPRSVISLSYGPPQTMGTLLNPPPLISEDFSAGPGGMSPVDGAWSASGGVYRATAPGAASTTHLNTRAVHAAAVSGDFTLDADASVADTASAWNDFAVVFGYQDANNYYFFSSNESNDAATNGLFKVVNGVSTELADAAGTITAGATYHVRVGRSGNQINAYRNGSLAASAADSTFTAGRVGFGTKGDAATFDNLVVAGTAAPAPAAPAAPSNLTATAASATQVNLTWADNSTNESGFKVERSTDGVTFTQVATVGSNATGYTASGLLPSTAYTFRVRAYNATGDSAYTSNAVVTTPAAGPAVLASPPQSAVDAAIAAPLIRFNRAISGGAYTNGAWFGGASVTLALASYAGNASADARLLEQARYVLTGGNDVAANGGYPAQHERHATGMFALMKLTPRVWNQLTDAERHKVDLVMEGTLVASAFTTSDANPYVTSGQSERTLDGDTNLGRDWNPNYREGMVGAMLVAAAYFGPAQAQALLANFDHAAFLADVQASGLSNLYQTFNWKAANPASIAPAGSTIQSTVRQPYAYHGAGLGDLMGLYNSLLVDTYGKAVNAGLNGGAGIGGGGKIASGADTLPNPGALGMLKEFDSADSGGPRSAANYAYDGFRPHQTDLLVMIASGLWQGGSAVAQDAARRLEVGNTDLWYKLDRGYIGYYAGANQGVFSTATDGDTFGFAYTRPVWESVLRPYLQAQGQPSPLAPPAAPSGLTAAAASSTQVNLAWADNSADESGFKVERSTDGVTFTQVASVGANVKSYSATGLAASTAYTFRVRAFNAAGDSAYSNNASATTPAAPAAGARPGPDNTGPSDPSLLVSSGSITTTRDGQVIENVSVSGTITVRNNNVTIRNFRLDGNGTTYPIGYESGHTGLVIEDGEVFDYDAAVVGGNFTNYTARRLNVHDGTGDGFKAMGNVTIESSYVHHLGTSPSSHADGVQASGGSGLTIRNNNFDMPKGLAGYTNSCAIFVAPDFGPISNVLIEGNWLNGGDYTVHIDATNAVVRDNLFGRDYEYGPKAMYGTYTWTNNRWMDTLALIP